MIFFQRMTGDSIASLPLYPPDSESDSELYEEALLSLSSNDPPYDPRYNFLFRTVPMVGEGGRLNFCDVIFTRVVLSCLLDRLHSLAEWVP